MKLYELKDKLDMYTDEFGVDADVDVVISPRGFTVNAQDDTIRWREITDVIGYGDIVTGDKKVLILGEL